MVPSIVYLVDDTADYRFLVSAVFKQSIPLHALRVFANSSSFLEQIERMEPKPSLVILDQHMPDPDGYHTLLLLKHLDGLQHIPVVMMSSDASQTEIKSFYQGGAHSFIQKPMDLVALKDALLLACQYAK